MLLPSQTCLLSSISVIILNYSYYSEFFDQFYTINKEIIIIRIIIFIIYKINSNINVHNIIHRLLE